MTVQLFLDTETDGLVADRKVLQLSWIVVDSNKIVKEQDFYWLPENYTITPSPYHHCNQEINTQKGKPWDEILNAFAEDLSKVDEILTYNITFDDRSISNELIRRPELLAVWRSKPKTCILKMARSSKVCQHLPKKSLSLVHEHFFPNEKFKAHDAIEDVKACRKVYLKLQAENKPKICDVQQVVEDFASTQIFKTDQLKNSSESSSFISESKTNFSSNTNSSQNMAGKPWTNEEDDKLIKNKDSKISVLATQFGRTEGSIKSRLKLCNAAEEIDNTDVKSIENVAEKYKLDKAKLERYYSQNFARSNAATDSSKLNNKSQIISVIYTIKQDLLRLENLLNAKF